MKTFITFTVAFYLGYYWEDINDYLERVIKKIFKTESKSAPKGLVLPQPTRVPRVK